jgi:hypothetical protein
MHWVLGNGGRKLREKYPRCGVGWKSTLGAGAVRGQRSAGATEGAGARQEKYPRWGTRRQEKYPRWGTRGGRREDRQGSDEGPHWPARVHAAPSGLWAARHLQRGRTRDRRARREPGNHLARVSAGRPSRHRGVGDEPSKPKRQSLSAPMPAQLDAGLLRP